MPDPELHPAETDGADGTDDAANRRIAALLLAAILVATFVALAAGQAFAASNGCGEPGHGEALYSRPES